MPVEEEAAELLPAAVHTAVLTVGGVTGQLLHWSAHPDRPRPARWRSAATLVLTAGSLSGRFVTGDAAAVGPRVVSVQPPALHRDAGRPGEAMTHIAEGHPKHALVPYSAAVGTNISKNEA